MRQHFIWSHCSMSDLEYASAVLDEAGISNSIIDGRIVVDEEYEDETSEILDDCGIDSYEYIK